MVERHTRATPQGRAVWLTERLWRLAALIELPKSSTWGAGGSRAWGQSPRFSEGGSQPMIWPMARRRVS